MVTAATPATTDSVISQVVTRQAALWRRHGERRVSESPQLPITAGLTTPRTNRTPEARNRSRDPVAAARNRR
jgi:hypothetical protein